MAVVWAVSSGAHDVGARWNTGVVPGPGDDVYANGFTITIGAGFDWVVASFRTRPTTGVVAGGTFTSSAGSTMRGDCYAGTTTCLTMSNEGTLYGDSYGSNTTSSRYGANISGRSVQYGNAYGSDSSSNALGSVIGTGSVMYGDSYAGAAAHGVSLVTHGVQYGNCYGSDSSIFSGSSVSGGGTLVGNSYAGLGNGRACALSNGGSHVGDAYGSAANGGNSAGTLVGVGCFFIGRGFGGSGGTNAIAVEVGAGGVAIAKGGTNDVAKAFEANNDCIIMLRDGCPTSLIYEKGTRLVITAGYDPNRPFISPPVRLGFVS